jgi:hypothetical protein
LDETVGWADLEEVAADGDLLVGAGIRDEPPAATSRTRTCFFVPVSDMPNGWASSLIVALPLPRRSRTNRRVGSARAANVRSTGTY